MMLHSRYQNISADTWQNIKLGSYLASLIRNTSNELYQAELHALSLTHTKANFLIRLHDLYQTNIRNSLDHYAALRIVTQSIINRKLMCCRRTPND